MNLQIDHRTQPSTQARRPRGVVGPTAFAPPRGAPRTDIGGPNDDLRSRIQTVISGGGPSVVFQPVVHLETSIVIGAEALSRFPGPLRPGHWFQGADQVGLGIELELSAAAATLRRLESASWARLGWDFVGINVSPSVIVDDRFHELVVASVPDRIVVELIEEVGVVGPFAVRSRLEALRGLGVRIAVNSVECTWADVHRSLDAEPEIIKLGTDFTAALVRDEARHDEARVILDECRRHGVFVVAVGVEHTAELATLRGLGVDAAQGYVFGWPAPDALDGAPLQSPSGSGPDAG